MGDIEQNKISFRFQASSFKLKVLVFFFSVCFALPFGANAARLYFNPQELVIGTQGDFSVVVNVDAPTKINTLAVAIKVPANLVPVDVYNGNSIINLWVDKPSFDEASRLLIFSGIIPGGFAGESAPLLIIKFKVKEGEDKALLSFNKEETKVFLHTPDGIEDTLELIDLLLPIIKGKENLRAEPPDDDPPESFLPIVAQDSTIWEGKYFLVFTTQDKGSGIGYYEVCEGSQKNCVVAESPYLLQNQKLDQKIFVKVFDKSGNERIAMLPAQKPRAWYKNYLFYAIIIIIVISIITVCLLWANQRRKKILR